MYRRGSEGEGVAGGESGAALEFVCPEDREAVVVVVVVVMVVVGVSSVTTSMTNVVMAFVDRAL